mmetsp:Transcript_34853/g.70508  ORF Transcript_34853/g.70508 Transcript_34853/m.70508 type:complete len:130 (+) Transcript_34853:223-612(+)
MYEGHTYNLSDSKKNLVPVVFDEVARRNRHNRPVGSPTRQGGDKAAAAELYTKKEMPIISELEIDSSAPSSTCNAETLREYYAKSSLLLFYMYAFRDFGELKHEDGMFWSNYIWAKKTGKLWRYDPKNV